MIIKEWKCKEHGAFECSDPICPALGCLSEQVVQEFRTPPMVRSRMVKQHDQGIRELSDRMGGANFRSGQVGDTAFGGTAGNGVLWGNDAAKFLGHPVHEKALPTDAMKSSAAVATRQDFVSRDMKPPAKEIISHSSDATDRKKIAAS